MSWEGYVTSLVGDQSIITKAAIIGRNGAIWTPAGPSNPLVLNILQAEASGIATVMNSCDPEVVEKTFGETGITVGSVKYMFLRTMEDGKVVAAKKAGLGQLVLQSTVQAVLIAFIPEDNTHSAGRANTLVSDMCKYLEGSGY